MHLVILLCWKKRGPRLGSSWTHRQRLMARLVVRDPEEGRLEVRDEEVCGRGTCVDPGQQLQVSWHHL